MAQTLFAFFGAPWDSTSGGGQTASMSDSVTLSDSCSAIAHYSAAVTDSTTLSDVQSPIAHLLASLTDAVSLADLTAALAHRTASVSDSVALADLSDGLRHLIASVSDSLSLGDSISGNTDGNETLTETFSLSDSATALAHLAAYISESLIVSDQVTGLARRAAAIAESLTLADSATALAKLSAAISESSNLSDSSVGIGKLAASISETFTLGDIVSFSTSGGTSIDPGEENVLAGVAYMINGIERIGKRVFPIPPSNAGEFSLYAPLDAMKNLILGCQAWADACGGYANAQRQTFIVSAPAKSPLPHAIIDYGDAISSVRDAVEITRFNRSTSIMVYFAFAALSGDDETKNEQAFLTAINSIITFLEASQTYGGMAPVILAHELIDGPRRIEEHKRDKYGDIMEIAFSFKMEIPS